MYITVAVVHRKYANNVLSLTLSRNINGLPALAIT